MLACEKKECLSDRLIPHVVLTANSVENARVFMGGLGT